MLTENEKTKLIKDVINIFVAAGESYNTCFCNLLYY
jgi:hypothetical protein